MLQPLRFEQLQSKIQPHQWNFMSIKVGIVDDHQLFTKSLSLLLNNFSNIEVILTAHDGIDLQAKMEQASTLPDIVLLDVLMPNMDGIATAKWLRISYPSIRLVALSMEVKEETILRMIQAGCCTYLPKDTEPEELERALRCVYEHSYYNSDLSNNTLSQLLLARKEDAPHISEKEKEFLQFATSDQTYRQIATLMNVSERTIDGYRGALFAKFEVLSRTGMVLEAIRRGFVKI